MPLTTKSIQLNVSILILGCRDVVKGAAAKQELRLGKGSINARLARDCFVTFDLAFLALLAA